MRNQIFMIASLIVILCIIAMKKIEPDNKFYKYYAVAILILYSIYLFALWFQEYVHSWVYMLPVDPFVLSMCW